ncbi:cadherin domain-containing protein [Dactylococcopsis salina]|uniref:Cadherin domain-containing protein,von Willebrand factor type D domain protein n=1 Tax=Dactylococcopsis salina (strain PCC 8305) TaxID=13035 RepID=K9YQC6_DACS8|nr:cadherin domain-containing protein [Dactylococcopsis salina]AFZ49126.1 Cadherin domain-containing protein,von Willebrand factor type D domain protein [Dactylococcopsis salina PCC 8305]
MNFQIIQLATPNLTVEVDSNFDLALNYNTSPVDNTLTGIALRLHYDSSNLTFNETSNLFATDLFGEVNSFADEENFDNDSQTDRYLQFQYFNFNGNWPDQPLPLNLGNFNFTVENPFSDIDPNPIDLILENRSLTVEEEVSGVSFGTLNVLDPNQETVNFNVTSFDTASGYELDSDPLELTIEETFTFTVSDDRLEVVNGELKLKDDSSFDFETDGDSVNVTVTATGDTGITTESTFEITVTEIEVNETPQITISNQVEVSENTTQVTTVAAIDPDENDTLTFSLSEGADADFFTINEETGELSFINPPDFESPESASGDNSYEVTVAVRDTADNIDRQTLTVNVTDVNESPSLTSPTTVSIAENQTDVTTITAIDPDSNETLTFSLSGGADADLFTINEETGELNFIQPPDFQNPRSASGDNNYEVEVTVGDRAENTDTETLNINVTDQVEEVSLLLFENNNGEKGDRIFNNTVNPGQEFFAEFFIKDIREKINIDQLGINGLGLDIDFDEEQFELISPLDEAGQLIPETAITAQGFDFFQGGNYNPETGEIEGLSASSINLEGEDNPSQGNRGRFESFARLGLKATTTPDFSTETPPLTVAVNPTQEFSLEDGNEIQGGANVPIPFLTIAPEVEIDVRLFSSVDGEKGEAIASNVNPGERFFLEVLVKDNRENLPESEQGITGLGLDIGFNSEAFNLVSPLDDSGNLIPSDVIIPESFTNFVNGEFDVESGLIQGLSASSIVLDGDDGSAIGTEAFSSFALLEMEAKQTKTSLVDQLDLNLNSTQGLTLQDGKSESDINVGIEQEVITVAPPIEYEIVLFEDNNGEKGDLIAQNLNRVNPGETFFADVLVRDNRVNLPEENTGISALGIDFEYDPDQLELISPLNEAGELNPEAAIVPPSFTSFIGGTFDRENGLIEGLSASSIIPDSEDGSAIGVGEFSTYASLGFQATQELNLANETIDQNFQVTTNSTQGFALNDGKTEQDITLNDELEVTEIAAPVEVEIALFENNNGEVGDQITNNLITPEQNFFAEIRVRDNRTNLPTEDLGISALGVNLDFDSDVFSLIAPLNEDNTFQPAEAIIPESFTSFIQGNLDAENGLIESLSASSIRPGEENGDPIGVGEYETLARLQFQTENVFASNVTFDLEINPTQGFALADGKTNNNTISEVFDQTVNITSAIFEQDRFIFNPINLDGISEGEVIGEIGIIEESLEDAIELQIISGNDSNNNEIPAFTINSETGEISVANLEEITEITTLTINASDPSGLLDTTTVEIPLNNSPTFTSSDAIEVSENETSVVTLSATDPDGDTLSFSITGGVDAALFTLDDEGSLSFSNAPDFETPSDEDGNNVYQVTVTVDDGKGSTVEQDLTVNLTDVNEAPIIEDQSFSIPENSEGETVVGAIEASDPEGNSLSYSLEEEGFGINETGEIFVTGETDLDFETNPNRELTVTVSDGEFTPTATVTVNLTDVNEAPIIEDQSFSIPENSEGETVVGAIEASDPEGNSLSYSLEEEGFGINETGEIFVTGETDLDFETNPNRELTVTVSDGEFTPTATVTVNLTDVNEAPIIEDQSFSIPENSEGETVVGAIEASDPEGNSLSYSLEEEGFGINETGEIFVTGETDLDFETNPNRELTVTVSDGEFTPTATVTVNLTDVNEAPTFTSDNAIEVSENETSVVTLSATDPDGDALSFSITGGADEGLFILNDEGGLSFSNAPDFENPGDEDGDNAYQVTVTVDDGNGSTVEQDLTVTVTDVDEVNRPPIVRNRNFEINESVTNGTEVGQLPINDPDGDDLSVSLNTSSQVRLINLSNREEVTKNPDVDKDGNPPFTIDATGVITVNDTDDLGPLFESINSNSGDSILSRIVPSFELTVEVSDEEATTIGSSNIEMILNSASFGLGDPHVSSFDRNNFSFQVVGEFTVVESTDENNPLTIQVRTSPTIEEDGESSDSLSNYTAIATEVNGDTIALYAGEENPVFINGENVSDLNETPVTDLDNGLFQINLDEAGEERIVVQVFENRIDPRVFLSEERNGNIAGVFGDKDGNPNDDFTLRDGTILPNPTFDQINNQFAQSWRTTDPANSLLLREGENLAEINDTNFPAREITLEVLEEQLGTDRFNDIVQQVEAAGLTEGFLRTAAIIDFATTNDDSFITSALNVAANNGTPQVEDAIFSIEPNANAEDVVGELSIRDGDDQLNSLTLSILQGNDDLDQDEESPFAVSVVEVDGQFQPRLTVNDPDDLEPEMSLTVQATDPLGATDTGLITIVQNDPNTNQAPILRVTVSDVDENSPVGTNVGRAGSTDPEGESVTLSLNAVDDLDGDGEEAFQINPETGLITVADPDDLNFEAQDSLTFNVIATDDEENTTEEEVTVNVNDLQTEVDVTLNLLNSDGSAIEENRLVVGENFFVEILVSADDPSGISTFSANLDFDEQSLDVLTPQFDTPSDLINEKLGFAPARVATFSEGMITLSGGTTDAVTDADEDGVADNVIGANNTPERFAIVEMEAVATTEEGTLTLTVPGENEDGRSIGATLGNGTPLTNEDITLNLETETLTVEVDNNPPVLNDQSFSVNENSEEGTVIGTIDAEDADGDDLTFSFGDVLPTNVDQDGQLPFGLDENSGELTVADPDDLNLAIQDTFNFDVVATDSANAQATGTVTVNVNPPRFSLDVDNNGDANGSVDGLNLLRVLFNLNPETMDTSQTDLTQQQVFDNIQQGLEGDNPLLDVDNSDEANGSVDGLNLLRVLFNLNPETMDTSQTDLTQQQVFDNIQEVNL